MFAGECEKSRTRRSEKQRRWKNLANAFEPHAYTFVDSHQKMNYFTLVENCPLEKDEKEASDESIIKLMALSFIKNIAARKRALNRSLVPMKKIYKLFSTPTEPEMLAKTQWVLFFSWNGREITSYLPELTLREVNQRAENFPRIKVLEENL